MATYTPIADNELDPGSIMVEGMFLRLRDNPEASFEGAAGAARLMRAALNSALTAGDVLQYGLDDDTVTTLAADTWTTVLSFPSLQNGTVRLKAEYARSGGGTAEIRVRRQRRGVAEAILDTGSNSTGTYSAYSYDATFQAGDLVEIQVRNTNTAPGEVEVRNVCLATGSTAETIFPGPSDILLFANF